MSETYTLILTNCRDDNEADYMIKKLFEDKLVACVQTNKVHSHYFWQDKIIHDSEIRLLIKTKRDLFEAVEKKILSLHSYELPEIIEIPIGKGSQKFFDWIEYATQ